MFSRFHDRFGTVGLVVAIVALVAAMSGGAYAASNGLSGKQKKEVKAIAKAEAKKYAKRGPQGPAGSQGAPGAQGAAGARGPAGVQGPAGGSGPAGPQGPAGAAGSPWTAGGTLPSGQSESGAWAYGMTPSSTSVAAAPISFGIPMPEGTLPAFHYIKAVGEEAEKCPGTAAEPLAAKGNLCVYLGEVVENPGTLESSLTAFTYNASGITLVFNTPPIAGSTPAEFKQSLAAGSWAVTAG